jgi:hypothetical protein
MSEHVCPLAAHGRIGAGSLFALFLALQASFFFGSALLVGRIEGRIALRDGGKQIDPYALPNGGKGLVASLLKSWRLFYRNALGFASIIALALVFLLDRF